MRTKLFFVLFLALLLSAVSLSAGHRHRRNCGHVFDPYSRSWVSVRIFSERGGFYFGGYRSRRDYDRYWERRRHRRNRYFDRYDYYERRYGRRRYHRGHRHDHFGRFCPRY